MSKLIYMVALLLILSGLSIATADLIAPADEWEQYLNDPTGITFMVCNGVVFQGVLVDLNETTITIDEMCNPELGDVVIRRECCTLLSVGYTCLG